MSTLPQRAAPPNFTANLCPSPQIITDQVAELKPWPKLFQNLRASRATELAGQFPAHVAAEWLGHSRLVAQDHYWRVTDADFSRAAGSGVPRQSECRVAQGVARRWCKWWRCKSTH